MKASVAALILAITFAGCELLGLGSGIEGAIESTFVIGDDGWTTWGDAESETVTHSPENGYIFAEDSTSGDWWYFSAPEKYLGDVSEFYGGTIAYQIKLLDSSPDDSHTVAEVILTADVAGDTVELGINRPDVLPDSDDWTTVNVPLASTADWVDRNTGQAATEAQIQAALGNLTSLYICGEYTTGSDSSALRYVGLIPPQ